MANEATKLTINGVQHDIKDAEARRLIALLQAALDAMTGTGTTTAIETFQEVLDFLAGVTDDETLVGKITALQTAINGKVDKETGKGLSTEDFTAALKAKLEALDPYTKTEVDEKVANAGKVKSVSVNGGAPVQPDAQGNVNINVQAGGLTKDDISVETQGDGTVDINVKDDTYKINLNHTHENMAKIVKCTESTLPQTFENDTIYVQVDDASNPTEIESLYLFGLEFTGGGVPAGTPAITRPSGTTINLGENHGSGVSKTVEIKANTHITGDLTVGLAANSDLSFDTSNLPSGVTYNSGAGTLTIAQATAMQGVNITIVYSGSGAAEIDGGLVITGGGAQPKSVVVVVELPRPVGLTAIKTTGTQYFDLGYKPNPNTKFELDVKFEKNTISDSTTAANNCCVFLSAPEESGKFFIFQTGYGSVTLYSLMAFTNTTKPFVQHSYGNESTFCVRGLMEYSNGSLKFLGCTQSPATMSHTCTQSLLLGYGTNKSKIFDVFNMYVYGLKIYEGSTLLHDFKPVTYQGTPGLYDEVNDTFISSASGTNPIAIE